MTVSARDQNMSPLRLAEEAWNHVAEGYRSYWSSRFAPFLQAALEAFQPPSEGAIAVPGCGPGNELVLLAEKFPGRAILGTDLSPRMVDLARQRVRDAGLARVLVACDEAAQLSTRIRSAGGIFSSFTLQLLPDPPAAIGDWALALRHGGQMALLFWPRAQERGAFSRLIEILRDKIREDRPDWECAALQAFPQMGLKLRSDQELVFEMAHDSPQAFWNAVVESGPFQVSLRRLGKTTLDDAGAAWLKDHGLENKDGRWLDRPAARLWIADRTGAETGQH